MSISNHAEQAIANLFSSAGVSLNGNAPWDPQFINPRAYYQLLVDFELACGETYVAGDWECRQLDEFVARVLRASVDQGLEFSPLFLISKLRSQYRDLAAILQNQQSKQRATKVSEVSYDLGSDFFAKILGQHMNYTCGYWQNVTTLDAAQELKMHLICKKLNLQPGQTLLDIGCGYGCFARFATENYHVQVTGITNSKEQYEFAKKYCAGSPIAIRFQDYRDTTGIYNHIVCLGMFEHVGFHNHREYMQLVHRLLLDEGLLLIQCTGNNYSTLRTNAWMNRYIFPNGDLPSIAQIGRACEKLFVMEDWHNLSGHYDKTLMAWYQNFIDHWETIKLTKDERFFRIWSFYLLSCAGAFRARDLQLWQIVLSKNGLKHGYRSIR